MDDYRLDVSFSAVILAMVVTIGIVLASGFFTGANCWTRALWPSARWIDERQEFCVATVRLCPSAGLTTADCFMKRTTDGTKSKVNFRIGIKNISGWARRYKVSAFLSGGLSAEIFCPSKGESSLLQPGDEALTVLSLNSDQKPEALTLRVECPWTLGNTHIVIIEKCTVLIKKILSRLMNVPPPDMNKEVTLTRRLFCKSK